MTALREDGKPRKLKKDGSIDKRGGRKPGSGRPRKIKHLSNYDKAIKLLDDNVEMALQVIIEGAKDKKDKKHAAHCAELLLRKALPDRVDLKNEFRKEIDKINKDMSKLSNEELLQIVCE